MAADSLPGGVISPVADLTYLKRVGDQGIGSLSSALNVDVLLTVIVNFGVDQRNNGSAYVLTAKPFCALIIPPGRLVWGSTKEPMFTQQVLLPITLVSNAKLALSLGAKWVVMSGLSESDYAELMKIAAESGSNMAAKTGEVLFDRLARDLKDARTVKTN